MRIRTIFKALFILLVVIFLLTAALFVIGGEGVPVALFVAFMNIIGAQFTPFTNFATLDNGAVLVGELLGVVGEITITIVLTTAFYEFLRHIDIGVKIANRKLSTLSGHIVISPINPFSIELGRKLKADKVDFVLADKKRSNVVNALGIGLLAVEADLTSKKGVSRTMIESASTLILLGDNDIDNVVVTIAARTENPNIKIVSRARRYEDKERIMSAGASIVVLPELAIGEGIGEFFSKKLK